MTETPRKLRKRVTVLASLLVAVLTVLTPPLFVSSSVTHAQVGTGCDPSRGRYSEVVGETDSFIVIRSCGSSAGDFVYVYDKDTGGYYFATPQTNQ